MKKNKRLIILLIILVVLVIIAILEYLFLPKETYTYNYLKGTEWVLNEENSNETIYLYENNDFLYFDNSTGESIKGFNSCTTYELENRNIKLNCDKKLKIISSNDTKLYLKIDDKNKTFIKKEYKNYKTFKVGYIETINTKILLNTYEDFIEHLNTFSNDYYDEEGNVVGKSTDVIKTQYNKEYFDKNNLAIYYVPTNSGGIKIKNIKTLIDKDTVDIRYDLAIPEISTMDMSGYIITVEIDKTVTKLK